MPSRPDTRDRPTDARPRPSRPGLARAAAFLACLVFAVAAMAHFHDQQWNGYDDGAYLHVADRMLAGEVLNRDVADHHAGYVNFANMLAMRVFGNDAVSLRYPLAVMGVLMAALTFWLLSPAGTLPAVAASFATTCLSMVQFMNPSANWYALFVAFLAAAVMARVPPGTTGRVFTLGVLVAAVSLFRQLTGVFVAMGVLFYLLVELPQDARGGRAALGRVVMAVMALGLAAYLLKKVDAVTLAMYGVWPLALLVWGTARSGAANGDVVRLLVRLGAGGVVGALPLLAYHAYHRSLGAWFNDTVVSAVAMNGLNFFDDFRYWRTYMLPAAKALVRPHDPAEWLNDVFWVVTPLLPVMAGAVVAWSAWKRGNPAGLLATAPPGDGGRDDAWRRLAPLPVLGVFYLLVALHFQKWLYFFFAAPLALAGLLALSARAWPLYRRGVAWTVICVSAIAFVFMAGPVRSIVPGREGTLVAAKEHQVPRLSLEFEEEQVEHFRRILAVTEASSAPGDPILVLPVAPEIYYVTGRRNPTRFHNTALDLRTQHDVEELLKRFESDRDRPRLVFFSPKNRYVTPPCRDVVEWVARTYEDLGQYGSFRVYRDPRPTAK